MSLTKLRSHASGSLASSRTLSSAEIRELRRVVDSIPMRLWAVAVIAFWERFTFWGLTAPWRTVFYNYMQNPPNAPPGTVSGALNLGQAMATRIYCAFYIFYYVTPIFFAILSDTRLGRFATLNISVILYAIGCTILMVTSHPTYIEKGYGLPGFAGALVLIGLGGGGFHAIIVPFIADQYTDTKPKLKILKSGERVVTDRPLTIQYIYNLYYWVGNLGSLSWFATAFLEKHYNFHIAYLLTVFSIVLAMLILFVGGKWYVKVPHEGQILPKATKILLCASKNGFKMTHAEPAYQLEHRGKTVSWSSQLVCELSSGLKACRVLIAFVVFYICFDQMQNNLISQAATMEPHNIPNDIMPAMNQVACIIFGPLIQSVLYPFLHRRKIFFKPIARITVGFGFVALSMLYATLVQQLIYTTGPCYKNPRDCPAAWSAGKDLLGTQLSEVAFRNPNHVNIWIQTPVYILIAIGEIFAYVTGLEYAYDNSPKGMKAIVQAISLLLAGVGSSCAMALSPIARDPYLVLFYACLACAMVATTIIFWFVFHKYD
ncbi:hypothetical protein K505DRAFT_245859, partial [Melanomma pulvis-pyrius CBS 109.77]